MRSGRKVIPEPLKKGTLGGKGFFSRSAALRHSRESQDVRRYGFRKVAGKLTAVEVFNKNRNPALSSKARSDERWLHNKYRGSRR